MGERLDRYAIRVVIDSANKVIRFSDSGSVITITLTEGTYWLYHSTGAELAGYPSLYKHLLTQLNAAATDTYAFELAQPAGDDRDAYHGLALVKVSGTADFGWYFSFASFTFPPELLGYPSTQAVDATTTGDRLVSTRAMRGQWISARPARSKISYARQHIEESTEEVERDDAHQMRWSSRRVRILDYVRQPGVFVHKSRGQDHTDSWGLPTGEDHVAFEYIWEALSRLEDVLLFHDVGGYSDGWDYAAHSAQIEVIRSYDRAQREDFQNVATLTISHGEQYDLMLAVVHRGGDYER